MGMETGEWELNRWEWAGMGMLKAISAHLYYVAVSITIARNPTRSRSGNKPSIFA